MDETLARAQCGLNTAAAGQKNIHSRYNPLIEAERYIASLNLRGDFEYIILAECGLCYVIEPLRKKFPAAKIVSLHLSAFYAGKSAAQPDAEWTPDSAASLNLFLESEIDDIEADKIKIIEWRPSAGAYGGEYLNLIKDITAFVKRIDASKRTRKVFGRRWFRNVIKNCFLFNDCVNFAETTRSGADCIIAGAGPALEDAYGAIRRLTKNGAVLIAVSSAVNALLQAGFRPDIIIACDGGGWAPLHLFESLRFFRGKKEPYPVLAFSLSAAIPSQCAAFNLLPISDESLFQNIACQRLDIPRLSFPQRGTVSASAVDLALHISGGAIYTAGINFSHKDIRSHAKPYAFDALLADAASRFSPLYTLQFERSGAIIKSGANSIYANWFSGQNYPRKIYPITDSDRAFDKKARNIAADKLGLSGNFNPSSRLAFSKQKRVYSRTVTRFIAALIAALESPSAPPAAKEKLTLELSNMLLDGGDAPRNCDLREELLRVSEKYRTIEARHG
ncbi:MAG: DUF115 domain-containing protein [Spirochaetaceae bacterium]|jgi:hypothetical protein|nr:DUF115 domain-containing protein [Spirochaetaceae bacterium]